MDKKEFSVFASALKTYFPKEKALLPNKQAMELWYLEFADISFDVALLALRKCVAVNEWSPTIAEIKGKISSIHWEAYEAISAFNAEKMLPPEMYAQYKRIYEETKEYRNMKAVEPRLSQFMLNGSKLLLGGGNDDS